MLPTGAVGPSLGVVVDDRARRRKLKEVAAIEAEAADVERTVFAAVLSGQRLPVRHWTSSGELAAADAEGGEHERDRHQAVG
jgi:hypothetical protein